MGKRSSCKITLGAELEQIHQQQLQESLTVAISAIAGMGGIGKTESALQDPRKHCREESYPILSTKLEESHIWRQEAIAKHNSASPTRLLS